MDEKIVLVAILLFLTIGLIICVRMYLQNKSMKHKIGFTFKSIKKKERILNDPPKAAFPATVSKLQYKEVTAVIFSAVPDKSKKRADLSIIIKPYAIDNLTERRLVNIEKSEIYESFLKNIINAYHTNSKLIKDAVKNDLENQIENLKTVVNLDKSIHKFDEEIAETEKNISAFSMTPGIGPDHPKTIDEKEKLKLLEKNRIPYKKHEAEINRQKITGMQVSENIKDRIKTSLEQIENMKIFYSKIFMACHMNKENASDKIPQEFNFNRKEEEQKLIKSIIDAEIKNVMCKFKTIINNEWSFDQTAASLREGENNGEEE